LPGNWSFRTVGLSPGSVFTILGVIFSCVGLAMLLAITFLIGILFTLLGFGFLSVGLAALIWRYRQARTTVRVLQVGQAARGEIVSVEQNYNVTVNGRNPWLVVYHFNVHGRPYQGQVSTLNSLGALTNRYLSI
jgi:membrane protein implicated in regulation of membrane protease activity